MLCDLEISTILETSPKTKAGVLQEKYLSLISITDKLPGLNQ